MCGVAGVFRTDGRDVDALVLARMRDAMTHRGPDDQGAWMSNDRRIGLMGKALGNHLKGEADSRGQHARIKNTK